MKISRSTPLLILACASVAGMATSAFAASGGPDSAGYTWVDSDQPGISAAAAIIPVQTDLRALGYGGDEALIQITLPTTVFPSGFSFYGTSYTSFYLSSNGWLAFKDPGGNPVPTPASLPRPGTPDATLAWFWDDWTLDGTVTSAEGGGVVSSNDGYGLLLYIYRKSDPTVVARVRVTLYNTGVIQVAYATNGALFKTAATQVGIEDQNGGVGLSYMTNGVAQNGANFRDAYAVWFYPKAKLNCTTGVTALPCGTSNSPGLTSTGLNNVNTYNCATGAWLGNEKVYQFTLTQTASLDIALSNFATRNPRLFLMDATCNEVFGCRVGGQTRLQPQFVPPGTYYVVVDAPTAGDNGSYNISLTCNTIATNIACGETLLGEGVGGPGGITSWSCSPGLSGPERIYQLVTPQTSTLIATIANKTDPSLQVLLSDAPTFDPANPVCLAASPTQVKQWNTPAGSYLVSVDGTAAGSYDLSVQCESRLVCPAVPQTIDLANPTPIQGDTTGKPNNVESYYCTGSNYATAPLETGNYVGGEDVYEFDVTTPSVVSFLFSPASKNMRLLILRDCYEGSCVMEGGCSETLAPGHYRLVVDGIAGADPSSGAYSLTPLLMPLTSYNQWSACPECDSNPQGGNPCTHSADEISNKEWRFNSGDFCGTGCNFSLFAVVECGSEFHMPFWDVETGHMQIFDLFNQRFLDLTATNDLPFNQLPSKPGGPLPSSCFLTSTGTTVQWEDNTCTNHGCTGFPCAGNGDCRTNNALMDVSFAGTPNVCGVYRLDFLDWGGYEWRAYANCARNTDQQYPLYHDSCSAVAAYSPLPEAGISNVTILSQQCASGDVTGEMTVENVGCLPAAQLKVTIDEAPPALSHPKTYTLDMPKGSVQVVPWTYTANSTPTDLVFSVDPANQIRECSENSGSSVSCGFNSVLQRVVVEPVCASSCPQNPQPPTMGNVFLGVKRNPDAFWQWSPLTGVTISAYRVYKDGLKDVPLATRTKIFDVPTTVLSVTESNAVPTPPSVAYYQSVAASCAGDLESPY